MISAPEGARRIVEAFEAAGIDYAVGGALAYNFWSEPRGTKDIDFNLFVDESRLDDVFEALRKAGCEVDEAAARARARERGDFVATIERMRVDLFLPSVPYQRDAARTRVRIPNLDGNPAWILSAEAICVFKLMFFRTKDLGDVEHVVAKRGAALDVAHVRAALVEMVGEEDARVQKWDEIVRTFGRGAPRAGRPTPDPRA